jgi:calcium/calmodulin-dependent protein kinase (CaM kinase) II
MAGSEMSQTKTSSAIEAELLDVTHRLLQAIAARDWATYESLCDPSLTCFEPESLGHLVHGLPFHRFYFDLESNATPRNTTICSPHVCIINDTAIVCYTRLTQQIGATGQPVTAAAYETRVWQRQNGAWRMMHFHRSE